MPDVNAPFTTLSAATANFNPADATQEGITKSLNNEAGLYKLSEMARQNVTSQQSFNDAQAQRQALQNNVTTDADGNTVLNGKGAVTELYKSNPALAMQLHKSLGTNDLEEAQIDLRKSQNLAATISPDGSNLKEVGDKARAAGLRGWDNVPEYGGPNTVYGIKSGMQTLASQVAQEQGIRAATATRQFEGQKAMLQNINEKLDFYRKLGKVPPPELMDQYHALSAGLMGSGGPQGGPTGQEAQGGGNQAGVAPGSTASVFNGGQATDTNPAAASNGAARQLKPKKADPYVGRVKPDSGTYPGYETDSKAAETFDKEFSQRLSADPNIMQSYSNFQNINNALSLLNKYSDLNKVTDQDANYLGGEMAKVTSGKSGTENEVAQSKPQNVQSVLGLIKAKASSQPMPQNNAPFYQGVKDYLMDLKKNSVNQIQPMIDYASDAAASQHISPKTWAEKRQAAMARLNAVSATPAEAAGAKMVTVQLSNGKTGTIPEANLKALQARDKGIKVISQ
jgi:hypothetical protein